MNSLLVKAVALSETITSGKPSDVNDLHNCSMVVLEFDESVM